MSISQDQWILGVVRSSPEQGWRLFIDHYTPTLLAIIERAGLRDRDEAMEVYSRVCERLAERDCERLRQYRADRGQLAAWLTAVVHHVTVDWVRSRAGRRRLFECVKALDAFAQEVFRRFYWEGRSASAIAELVSAERSEPVALADVFDALARVETALSDRQRSELVSWTVRGRPPLPLDDAGNDGVAEALPADALDPEQLLRIKQLDEALTRAVAALPAEDAAIVRLKFMNGLSNREIARALRLTTLTSERVNTILTVLRATLTGAAPLGIDEAVKHLSLGGGTP